jgi:hypothetical protein
VASLTRVSAELRAGSSFARGAERALSSAASYARELLSTATAMELETLAARLAELTARLSQQVEATAALQQALGSALAAADALTSAARPPAPAPGRDEPRRRGSLERLRRKEVAIVDHLVSGGATVEILPENHSEYGVKHPDAVVTRPGEAAVITEFKTLEKPTSSAVKGLIKSAASQVAEHGGGDVVIDARTANLDEPTARRGYARAKGEARVHGRPMPRRTYIILDDGRQVIFTEDGA